MKTEMVVRGTVQATLDGYVEIVHSGPPVRIGTDVTLLLHGENGEVGGLEPWMVEFLRGDFGLRKMPPSVYERFGKSPANVRWYMAKILANILNPEDT